MNCKNLSLVALLATAMGMPQAAFAQQDSDSIFEEITVTATRREQSI